MGKLAGRKIIMEGKITFSDGSFVTWKLTGKGTGGKSGFFEIISNNDKRFMTAGEGNIESFAKAMCYTEFKKSSNDIIKSEIF